MLYKKKEEDAVMCNLCPHHCLIKLGMRGRCGVRENQDGTLYSLNYAKAVSASVDPIEKKPLFHFLPGSFSYSVAASGCNLFCRFCQNWQISQQPKPDKPVLGQEMPPEEIVDKALEAGCKSISYTYTEPTIFFEYAYETARLATAAGLKNVFVTNGYITEEAIAKISDFLDAANIDLKGFSEDYYRKVCGGGFQPVLDAIRSYHKRGVFVEITTLIVPGHNENPEMLKRMADFIASVSVEIPWHISRFHPDYMMQDVPATDVEAIHKAAEIGKQAGLKYIYSGNVYGDDLESTYCPGCKKRLIRRTGFSSGSIDINDNACPYCGERINLVTDD